MEKGMKVRKEGKFFCKVVQKEVKYDQFIVNTDAYGQGGHVDKVALPMNCYEPNCIFLHTKTCPMN